MCDHPVAVRHEAAEPAVPTRRRLLGWSAAVAAALGLGAYRDQDSEAKRKKKRKKKSSRPRRRTRRVKIAVIHHVVAAFSAPKARRCPQTKDRATAITTAPVTATASVRAIRIARRVRITSPPEPWIRMTTA